MMASPLFYLPIFKTHLLYSHIYLVINYYDYYYL